MASGCVVWITGLSGSGKTTLCNAIWQSLKPLMPQLVLLDGDAIRAAFGGGLGYREEDRIFQINRIQNIAKLLSDQGLNVLVAALYSNPNLLGWIRQNLNNYIEIYLEASLEALRGRDNNNLYAKAESGELTDVVGVDITWHAPNSPDMVINTDYPDTPHKLAKQVIASVPHFSAMLESA